MKPEKNLYHKFVKNCPDLNITSIECYNVAGIPDCLIWSKSGGFAMVELKHTTTNKIKLSPFQILFHTVRGDLINGKHRNFILVNQAPKGGQRTIKLYGSKSIQDILQGLDKAVPLAVDNWELIQKIIGNQKK